MSHPHPATGNDQILGTNFATLSFVFIAAAETTVGVAIGGFGLAMLLFAGLSLRLAWMCRTDGFHAASNPQKSAAKLRVGQMIRAGTLALASAMLHVSANGERTVEDLPLAIDFSFPGLFQVALIFAAVAGACAHNAKG